MEASVEAVIFEGQKIAIKYIEAKTPDTVVTLGLLVLFSTETGDAWTSTPPRITHDGYRDGLYVEKETRLPAQPG